MGSRHPAVLASSFNNRPNFAFVWTNSAVFVLVDDVGTMCPFGCIFLHISWNLLHDLDNDQKFLLSNFERVRNRRRCEATITHCGSTHCWIFILRGGDVFCRLDTKRNSKKTRSRACPISCVVICLRIHFNAWGSRLYAADRIRPLFTFQYLTTLRAGKEAIVLAFCWVHGSAHQASFLSLPPALCERDHRRPPREGR